MAEGDKSRPRWLLLLPCPPSKVSLNTLRVAYGPGLTAALHSASKISAGGPDVIMDIALAYGDELPDAYSAIQGLLGLMYRVICMICTEQHIDSEYGNDVDARLTLYYTTQNKHGGQNITQSNTHSLQKYLPDLQMLADIDRKWQCLCSLESEDGEEMLQSFLRARLESSQSDKPDMKIERFPGGLVMRQDPTKDTDSRIATFHRHHSVAVGGTFDHLHAGHKLLLTMTALVLNPESIQERCLTIGITGDELLTKKKYREELEDFPERQSAIQHFLLGLLELISPHHVLESTKDPRNAQSHGREVHDLLKSGLTIKYVEIFDPCGPTITDESISALVLSGETRDAGKVVNDKRGEKGWTALEVFEVDVLDAGEDQGTSLRSHACLLGIVARTARRGLGAKMRFLPRNVLFEYVLRSNHCISKGLLTSKC